MAQVHQVVDNQTVVALDMKQLALGTPGGVVEPMKVNQG
jgi:hypothetical protein